MTTIPTTTDWFVDFKTRIIAALSKAEEHIQQAAALYVEAITKNPAFRDWLDDEAPQVPPGVWRSLDRIGRGQLDPRIFGGCLYDTKLRRLPITEQRQALDGSLPLLTSSGDSMLIRLGAMMPSQADQVFAADHIRSLAEQRAYIESRETKAKAAIKQVPAVEIDKKHRRILVNGYPMTAADLADYLRKLSE